MLVSATGQTRADLIVTGGKVAAVGELSPIGQVVDATGLLIMPGMVDTHVHLMDPGATEREDFPTGTRAAAAHGVTTILEHTHSHPVRSAADLTEKRQYLAGRSNVDFGLAAHVWPDTVEKIPELVEAGVSFFKIFTCDTHGVPGLDPGFLGAAMDALAAVDGRALIHNEDQALTASAERRLKADGRSDPALLNEWRSRDAEMVAVASTAVLALSSRANVTFAHVSNTDVLGVVDEYRRLGADIAAEACPQYFVLEESEVEHQGPFRKFTPPARITSEGDRASMWEAVSAGRFSFFSTDHAPSTRDQKNEGDIWSAPFGLPGLDTTLPFLIDAALSGLVTMSDVVRLYSTRPAQQYRLPKGTLDVGADADVVIVDPTASWEVKGSDVLSKAGWSPYEGRTFAGKIVDTYLRGVRIASEGVPDDSRVGRFIRPG